jgi:uncharacterized protein YndB with AHSA1/START domain
MPAETTEPPRREVIHASATLDVAPQVAFEMFVIPTNIRKWLIDPFGGGEAIIDGGLGGRFELFWNAEGGRREGTPGCRITAFVPPMLLGFTWKGPSILADPMNRLDPLTHVTVAFVGDMEDQGRRTKVELIHSGWGSSPKFQSGYAYFERAWTSALKNLEAICAQPRSSS